MNEDRKLAEAEYFYEEMRAVQETPEHFTFNLSAFLTAARSALQYAHKQATATPQGQGWYDTAVGRHESIRFFRGKRNVNVHAEPVQPQKRFEVKLSEDLGVLDEATEVWIVKAGEPAQHTRSETPRAAPVVREATPPSMQVHYRFADWTGSEDAIALCRVYLDAVREVVADGQGKGFLS